MRRSWLYRLIGLFLAPSFALAAWDATGIHDCPMHGSQQMAHAMPQMQNPVPLGDSAAAADGSRSDSIPGHAAHSCTCMGCCCGTTPVALAADVPAIRATVSRVAATESVWIESRSASPLPHALPFATAPPLAVV